MDGQVLMGLGVLVAVIGLGMLLIPARGRNTLIRLNQTSAYLIAGGAIMFLIGAGLEWNLLP